ncbi:hypothetical protein SEVIR_9G549800v4 [Setaria viridis]|uniref:Uncharacterized protein n=2 Tax=Setaria TaxID=4554 RepID=K4ACB6_SETIT|nr:uncharacterized protein LOC101781347 [Setaria italica]XP_034574009.1 uncharacterized protein LOC117838191 [Setaria viridis]RCV46611.1 hypothetical protein SETIT_9G545200v2 [Setaria italica]TKV98288.1 hypothetical protein SEVIR_9G549800v2 [Setaria viridis]
MLVRSASTPVLGALLPPGCQSPAVSSPAVHFPESPAAAYHPPAISCHLAGHGSGSDHERSLGAGSGMRRTSSEGNLSSLASRADDHHHLLPPPGKCAPRPRPVPLETIQSFTDRRASTDDEDEEEEDDDDFEAAERELSFGQFSGFVGGGSTYSHEHPLFLARGLGIDRLGSGLLSADDGVGGFGGSGGGGSNLVTSGNGGDRSGIEMHYKKMIEEDPCNGLFLRNYAQFLYQVKGDYRRAEEYYSRAILADPDDGELLSEYAKLVWDVHRDEERASSYFERAAKASPENSHVLAAHAAFLWDTEDADVPEESGIGALGYVGFAPAHSSLASATT